MNKETKNRRIQLLQMQTEIEEQQCKGCTCKPGRNEPLSDCGECLYGKELLTIGIALDQALGPRRVNKTGYIIPTITDEAVEIAKSNGISITALRTRVQQLHWPLEKAITEPIDNRKKHKRVK